MARRFHAPFDSAMIAAEENPMSAVMPSAQRKTRPPRMRATSADAKHLPPGLPPGPVRRFTIAEYHRMIAGGLLTEDDPIELLEGFLVQKMPKGEGHDGVIGILQYLLAGIVPSGWILRIQCAVTFAESEPEPDVAIVKAPARQYFTHHPVPAEIGGITEVARTSLTRDQQLKGRIYARAGIPVYWVVDLRNRQVEVFTQPGTDKKGRPVYLKKQVYRRGSRVPVVLAGKKVGELAVSEILPS
jgi:Uma2 family endonuclease